MDQTYAPRSPNLAGYAPRSPDLAAYQPASPRDRDPYAPQSPDLSGLQQPQNTYPQQVSGFSLDQHHQQPLQQYPPQTYPPQQPGYPLTHHPLQQHPDAAQSDPYQQQFSYGAQQPLYTPQYSQYSDMPVQTRNRGVRAPGDVGSYNYDNSHNIPEESEWAPQAPAAQALAPQPSAPTPARRGRKPKSESSNGAPAPPPMKKMDTGGIEVKTKFPTARIKRIMQADEDVGKVAQVTPVVMAKALELFMIRLISASAGAAKQRGSKRVLSQHMKAAVESDERFDNLREIMSKVPDAPTKGANGDDSEDEEGAPKKGAARGKKAAAGGGRGKKRRDSDDF